MIYVNELRTTFRDLRLKGLQAPPIGKLESGTEAEDSGTELSGIGACIWMLRYLASRQPLSQRSCCLFLKVSKLQSTLETPAIAHLPYDVEKHQISPRITANQYLTGQRPRRSSHSIAINGNDRQWYYPTLSNPELQSGYSRYPRRASRSAREARVGM